MSLNPPPSNIGPTGRESGGDLSEIIQFWPILDSSVKTCKQCLQTASASGDFVLRPPSGPSSLDCTRELLSPDPLREKSPDEVPKWKFLAPLLTYHATAGFQRGRSIGVQFWDGTVALIPEVVPRSNGRVDCPRKLSKFVPWSLWILYFWCILGGRRQHGENHVAVFLKYWAFIKMYTDACETVKLLHV